MCPKRLQLLFLFGRKARSKVLEPAGPNVAQSGCQRHLAEVEERRIGKAGTGQPGVGGLPLTFEKQCLRNFDVAEQKAYSRSFSLIFSHAQ